MNVRTNQYAVEPSLLFDKALKRISRSFMSWFSKCGCLNLDSIEAQETNDKKWSSLEITLFSLVIMNIILIGILMPLAKETTSIREKIEELQVKSAKSKVQVKNSTHIFLSSSSYHKILTTQDLIKKIIVQRGIVSLW